MPSFHKNIYKKFPCFVEKRKQKKEKAKVFLLREGNQNHESEPQCNKLKAFQVDRYFGFVYICWFPFYQSRYRTCKKCNLRLL